jgi:hypothetical protein
MRLNSKIIYDITNKNSTNRNNGFIIVSLKYFELRKVNKNIFL